MRAIAAGCLLHFGHLFVSNVLVRLLPSTKRRYTTFYHVAETACKMSWTC